MGLSDYWNKNRVETVGASFDYVSVGFSSDSPDNKESQECIDSSECASGWACVGGKCQQLDTGAGDGSYGDTSGCGGGAGGGGGGGGCGASTGDSGSGSGCTKSGCGGSSGGGGGGGADDCCGGERCCRSGSCTCGPCPPPPSVCDKWCDDYLKANGELAEGCSKGVVCSECEACNLDDESDKYKCLERAGAPCNCPQTSCNGKCDSCTKEGVCEDDCRNCQTCYTTFKECSCGTVKKTCCYSACDQTKGYGDCSDSIDCGEFCPPYDPCAGECYGQHFCDEPEPPCPDGASCTSNGFITAGGKTCTIRTVCNKTSVPDSCNDTDCNCNNDCPDCFICNSEGVCESDPACEN